MGNKPLKVVLLLLFLGLGFVGINHLMLSLVAYYHLCMFPYTNLHEGVYKFIFVWVSRSVTLQEKQTITI